MYIVIDDNGFLQYATPILPVGQNYTEIEPAGHFIKAQFLNGVWIEGATAQEIKTVIDEKKTALKKEYSEKIDAVVNEFVQKKIITGEDIPAEVLVQRQLLIDEYNAKIILLTN